MIDLENIQRVTVTEVLQTIELYSRMLEPYKDSLLLFERQNSPVYLERLVGHDNEATNHCALELVRTRRVAEGLGTEQAFGVLARLRHNWDRLSEMDPNTVLLLAYYDEVGRCLQPCSDVLEYVLIHAVCDGEFAFLMQPDRD